MKSALLDLVGIDRDLFNSTIGDSVPFKDDILGSKYSKNPSYQSMICHVTNIWRCTPCVMLMYYTDYFGC